MGKVVAIAVGVLVNSGAEVLVTKRKEGGELGGYWEWPGGKVEAGESHEDCVVREFLEEVGMDVVVGDLIGEVEHAYDFGVVRIRAYFCGMCDMGQVVREIGVAGFPPPADLRRWVGPEMLRGVEFPEANAELVEIVVRRLGGDG